METERMIPTSCTCTVQMLPNQDAQHSSPQPFCHIYTAQLQLDKGTLDHLQRFRVTVLLPWATFISRTIFVKENVRTIADRLSEVLAVVDPSQRLLKADIVRASARQLIDPVNVVLSAIAPPGVEIYRFGWYRFARVSGIILLRDC